MQASFKKSVLLLSVMVTLMISILGGTILPAQAATTWQTVGNAGFSTEAEWFTSIAVDQGTPYVAYQDWDKGNKATVMKFDVPSGGWVPVGVAGFSSGNAGHTSLAMDGDTPYVAYIDGDHYNTATVMQFDGTDWVTVGAANFSPRYLHDLAFAIQDGTLFVAYTSQLDGYKATVMKFDALSGNWVSVGASAFSAGEADYLSLALDDGAPYVAYSDDSDGSGKATVMKYDSDSASWVTLGSAGFSAGQADSVSLALDGGTPYVAYADQANGGQATVMKFEAGNWTPVGLSGFSGGEAFQTRLVFDDGSPYVAFKDWSHEGRVTVMKFDGTDWNTVGAAGFSNDYVDHLSLAVESGAPYVAYKDLGNQGKATVMKFADNTPVVGVYVHGNFKGMYTLGAQAGNQQSYQAVNDGAVKMTSTNNAPFLGAEQVIYKANGVGTSFSEMLGLPDSQLDNTYWLPWYNNVDLDTQLRLGNVSSTTTTVNVYIGGRLMTPTAITLLPGEGTRTSFAGVNDGPVQIVSDHGIPIVAAERIVYKVNGAATSFSEMMALPNSQISTTYWLPWYNNVDMDTQLRFGNVSGNPAQVHVTIGGTEVPGSPFTLGAGESSRVSFAGINSGPVEIQSDHGVPIVAAERVIYKVNQVNTSFSETMALPNSQLTTTHWLPWYNNVGLDTQLRLGNVSSNPAQVHVTIGGVEMAGSPFTLGIGESKRISFPGVNDGPVKIQSDNGVPIVAAERAIYKVDNVNTSFSELLALPDSQLNTTYWLPWYNNLDLDTQLRFAAP